MPVVAVLGGSTPFTAALIEALVVAHGRMPPCELRLCGRDREALERIVRYGARRLAPFGWTVTAHARLDEGADGADVVVNQIRFGGLDGRAIDEALANRFGLVADETLGPGALSTVLRIAPDLRALASELRRVCPDAWVINLTNPLGVTTHVMLASGAPARCIGVCELPRTTAEEAARALGLSPDALEWAYAGLNHRGFLFDLKHAGEPVLHRLAASLGTRTISGVTAEDIRRVGALPLKYFRLSTTAVRAQPTDRARFLAALKDRLSRELDEDVAPPPSLSQRNLAWYDAAVVPMLEAIFAGDGRRLVVNTLAADGLVREAPARIWRDRVEDVGVAPPDQVRPWIERWSAHERAVLDAVRAPSFERIEHALSLDPSVPASLVGEISGALWNTRGDGAWEQMHCG